MKLNYGFKEGETVFASFGKAKIIEIFKAGRNHLGFKHALIEYQIDKTRRLVALMYLKKYKKCLNCKYWSCDNWCANSGIKTCSDDFCGDFEDKL